MTHASRCQPGDVQEGDVVKVFSHSADTWVDGTVAHISERKKVVVEYGKNSSFRKSIRLNELFQETSSSHDCERNATSADEMHALNGAQSQEMQEGDMKQFSEAQHKPRKTIRDSSSRSLTTSTTEDKPQSDGEMPAATGADPQEVSQNLIKSRGDGQSSISFGKATSTLERSNEKDGAQGQRSRSNSICCGSLNRATSWPQQDTRNEKQSQLSSLECEHEGNSFNEKNSGHAIKDLDEPQNQVGVEVTEASLRKRISSLRKRTSLLENHLERNKKPLRLVAFFGLLLEIFFGTMLWIMSLPWNLPLLSWLSLAQFFLVQEGTLNKKGMVCVVITIVGGILNAVAGPYLLLRQFEFPDFFVRAVCVSIATWMITSYLAFAASICYAYNSRMAGEHILKPFGAATSYIYKMFSIDVVPRHADFSKGCSLGLYFTLGLLPAMVALFATQYNNDLVHGSKFEWYSCVAFLVGNTLAGFKGVQFLAYCLSVQAPNDERMFGVLFARHKAVELVECSDAPLQV